MDDFFEDLNEVLFQRQQQQISFLRTRVRLALGVEPIIIPAYGCVIIPLRGNQSNYKKAWKFVDSIFMDLRNRDLLNCLNHFSRIGVERPDGSVSSLSVQLVKKIWDDQHFRDRFS